MVEVLSAAGFKVTALARRADRLSKLSDRTGCAVAVADVTDPAAMAGALSELEPDIVVCNAGLGAGFEGMAGTAHADIKSVIDTNVTGTLRLLNLVLPGMIARRRGHVVTIGSVAALYPSNSALYGASKAAIRQLALHLRMDTEADAVELEDAVHEPGTGALPPLRPKPITCIDRSDLGPLLLVRRGADVVLVAGPYLAVSPPQAAATCGEAQAYAQKLLAP